MNNFQDKANFIWQVADDNLRGTFRQHEFCDVILPFVVLRRLDCVLNGKKDEVIRTYEKFRDKLPDPGPVCLQATGGLRFYNTSRYDLQRLTHEAGNIEANFNNYINTLENMKYKADNVFDELLLDFVHTKLELYKKLSEAKVNEMLKSKWFEEILRENRLTSENLNCNVMRNFSISSGKPVIPKKYGLRLSPQ